MDGFKGSKVAISANRGRRITNCKWMGKWNCHNWVKSINRRLPRKQIITKLSDLLPLQQINIESLKNGKCGGKSIGHELNAFEIFKDRTVRSYFKKLNERGAIQLFWVIIGNKIETNGWWGASEYRQWNVLLRIKLKILYVLNGC